MTLWLRMPTEPTWLRACWPSTTKQGVLGFTTTRHGGSSSGAFSSNNIRFDIGDEAAAVAANRVELLTAINHQLAYATGVFEALPVSLQWLDQVHGSQCVYVDEHSINDTPEADAAWTDKPGIGIAIQTADCVPILIADQGGGIVGAVHAGWRGVAANIVNNLVVSMPAKPKDLMAWIGPCIGLRQFEVGEDVWSVMMSMFPEAVHKHPSDPSKRLIDLALISRWQLQQCGVGSISAANICTYASADFYSYRQACHEELLNSDSTLGQVGRMASVVVCNSSLTNE
jgi:hypothetical protein